MHKFKIKFWKHIPKFVNKYRNDKASINDYMNVYLFDTKEDMYKKVEKLEKVDKLKPTERDYNARCFSYTRVVRYNETGERKYTPLCGNLYFCMDSIGSGVVSHECGHAIIGYFNRKIEGYNKIFEELNALNEHMYEDCAEHEELFCYMLGSLVNQIYTKYWDIEDGKEKNMPTEKDKVIYDLRENMEHHCASNGKTKNRIVAMQNAIKFLEKLNEN